MTKIMTLNINGYGEKHGDWSHRKKLMVDTILRFDPDIIALQAVRSETPVAGGVNQAAQLISELPYVTYLIYEPATELSFDAREGSAILSRYAAYEQSVKRLTLGNGVEDTTVRLVLQARFNLAKYSLNLFNCHFSWVERQNEGNLEEALPFIQAVHGPALMLGDFNIEPASRSMQELCARGWVDAWSSLRGDEPGYTFESHDPDKRIDYFWMNRDLQSRLQGIEVVAVERHGARLSDHLGLIASFDI